MLPAGDPSIPTGTVLTQTSWVMSVYDAGGKPGCGSLGSLETNSTSLFRGLTLRVEASKTDSSKTGIAE